MKEVTKKGGFLSRFGRRGAEPEQIKDPMNELRDWTARAREEVSNPTWRYKDLHKELEAIYRSNDLYPLGQSQPAETYKLFNEIISILLQEGGMRNVDLATRMLNTASSLSRTHNTDPTPIDNAAKTIVRLIISGEINPKEVLDIDERECMAVIFLMNTNMLHLRIFMVESICFYCLEKADKVISAPKPDYHAMEDAIGYLKAARGRAMSYRLDSIIKEQIDPTLGLAENIFKGLKKPYFPPAYDPLALTKEDEAGLRAYAHNATMNAVAQSEIRMSENPGQPRGFDPERYEEDLFRRLIKREKENKEAALRASWGHH